MPFRVDRAAQPVAVLREERLDGQVLRPMDDEQAQREEEGGGASA